MKVFMMKSVSVVLLMVLFLTAPLGYAFNHKKALKDDKPSESKVGSSVGEEAELLYLTTGLYNLIDKNILNQALTGFKKINPKKPILAIIDFNRPSSEERLYVIDVEKRQLLFHTLVAHGKNSGGEYATSFSNTYGSLKSSLGFFLTGETIVSPKHGYAMILNGLEAGINDNAKNREIIVHSADYVSDTFVARNGMLGRSWGCPALPTNLNKQIIDVIKDGAVLYIAGKSPSYNQRSTYLR